MNNLRNVAAMALLVAMLVGMTAVAPATPVAKASTQVVPTSSLTESVLQDWVNYLDEARPQSKLDSLLTSYKDTGIIPSDVAVGAGGKPSVLIAISKGADIDGLKSIVDVKWMMDFKVAIVVSAYVDRANLDRLQNYKGVAGVLSDRLYTARVDGLEARPTTITTLPDEPAMYENKKLIGADEVVTDYGYTGTGQVVGVCDTGVDFSHPDLQGAMYFNPSTGMPESFDPSGYGVVLTMYRFNLTYVANTTRWFAASSWNKLSTVDPVTHKVYIPGTWNPNVNNLNGLRTLDEFVSLYLTSWWDDDYPNQANLTEFYKDVVRQPMEIPNASTTAYSGAIVGGKNYTFSPVRVCFGGYVFQQRNNPYMKVFAPAVVMNGTRLIIDWETANAHTQFWNLAINYGALDFNVTADRNYIKNLGDWNFTDNLAKGEWYSKDANLGLDHVVLAHDYTGDGIADFGLGAICTSWESIGYGVGPVAGFALGGRMVAILYDTGAHGTFVSGQIAGRGVLSYPVGLGGEEHKLYGVANGSKLIGESVIGTGSHLAANLWEAGFVYNSGTGFFEWSSTSGHQAVVSSNSWGWVAPQYIELQPLYSLMYAALSTPGFFDASYPGILYCFAAGNSGPGYATIGAPCAAQILQVGASTSYHTYENAYGPNQGYDQIASFSSRGPLSTGYSKPDVLAPGQNTFGIVPGHADYMLAYVEPGAYPLYATYAGTSMACPMVAGTVALLAQETGGVARPDAYKVVIESTAVDLGLDGMAQGHGRIDAYAAVQYLDGAGSGIVWGTYDSTINYGAVIDVAWVHYMDGSTGWEGDNSGLFINSTAMPTDFLDASLYYGVVSPGATVSLSMAGTYADTSAVDATDFTWDSQNYEVDNVWHGIWNTYIYNETTSTGSNSIKAGWFDLQTELGSAYSNFAAAPFATILIGGPTSLNPVPPAYTAKFYAFVFDWSDTDPANGVPDYYNPTTGHGDELTRIQYGGAQHTIRMDLSSPSGVGSLFPTNTPIVAIHDQSIWKWPYTSGTDVNVTIITWKPVSNGELAVSNNVAGGLSVDLTVPNDAEPGVHEGYLVAEGATNYLIPYSYFVSAEVATADGSETTVASGYGNVLNPMEDGASFVSQDYYYTTQSADHHAFIVHVSDTSAKYIGAKVEWANAASSFDVAIVSMTGVELGTSTDANKTSGVSASAIGELSAVPGDYLVYVTTNELYYKQLPSNFTLKVMCWTEVPAPTITYSWRSIDSPSYTVVTDGGKAVGDHVRMNATWTDAVLTNMPDYKITGISLQVLKGLLFTDTRALHIPTSGYSPYSGMLHLNEFVWVYVPGIKAGDNVRLTVDFDVTDVDILSYWADTDNTTWTAASDLFGEKLATGAVPEYGSFLADRAGTLAVGLFDYSREAGSAYVTVDTRSGVGKSAYSNTAEVDTYPLQSNCSTAVLVSVDTGTNFKYSDSITVETDNFLYPHLGPVSVSGSGAVKTITWSVSDLNSGDQHFYDLAISSDGGVTFQLLAGYLNTTSYTWDSTGFTQGTYIARITVYDNDPAYHAAAYGSYWPGLTAVRASASFTAGTVTTTTTTTTTSTTTTTTTTPVTGGIDPLWIGLFGGIGVGILVVLMLFLVRKK